MEDKDTVSPCNTTPPYDGDTQPSSGRRVGDGYHPPSSWPAYGAPSLERRAAAVSHFPPPTLSHTHWLLSAPLRGYCMQELALQVDCRAAGNYNARQAG